MEATDSWLCPGCAQPGGPAAAADARLPDAPVPGPPPPRQLSAIEAAAAEAEAAEAAAAGTGAAYELLLPDESEPPASDGGSSASASDAAAAKRGSGRRRGGRRDTPVSTPEPESEPEYPEPEGEQDEEDGPSSGAEADQSGSDLGDEPDQAVGVAEAIDAGVAGAGPSQAQQGLQMTMGAAAPRASRRAGWKGKSGRSRRVARRPAALPSVRAGVGLSEQALAREALPHGARERGRPHAPDPGSEAALEADSAGSLEPFGRRASKRTRLPAHQYPPVDIAAPLDAAASPRREGRSSGKRARTAAGLGAPADARLPSPDPAGSPRQGDRGAARRALLAATIERAAGAAPAERDSHGARKRKRSAADQDPVRATDEPADPDPAGSPRRGSRGAAKRASAAPARHAAREEDDGAAELDAAKSLPKDAGNPTERVHAAPARQQEDGGAAHGVLSVQLALAAKVVTRVARTKDGAPFAAPVGERFAPGYSAVVALPMDLGTVAARARAGAYASLGAASIFICFPVLLICLCASECYTCGLSDCAIL